MSQNGNPLIGSTDGDTIAGTCDLLEWMLIQAGQDEETHPGLVMQLRMVHGAVSSLKKAPGERRSKHF
ncbi:hypothetical protein [Pseudomonas aeruginosa]|uniref:hypothetical protein n=1 Tax=Pseudomonas aeruginosa TaxID=287 RepID=UPI000F886F71|nr:hypothetical protein [Pseudomonas aeruginosa]MDI3585865.1 hypothetical protein [Pseudomonas aeruginosa]MDI3811446.1 hypothetical protein [Pseudomonas aeruginosa]RUI11485.1 hypothetical protein IPC447_29830 [Pseudomonas aeruginosa]